MPRSTVARIDTSAIRHNYRVACDRAGTARAMAVIKADGYGHGIEAVAKALADDAPRYAVACLEEALAIREAGLSQPVVMLQGAHQQEDMAMCARQGFQPVLHSDYQLAWLTGLAEAPDFWLKVNTGMNRLGFPPEDLARRVEPLLSAAATRSALQGFVTHFSCADDAASDETAGQTQRLCHAAAPWPQLEKSVGNSAAHFLPGQPLFDWSRPGIMLYGSSPMLGRTGLELGLKAAMTLEAPLIATRMLKAGDRVGYGGTWVADRDTRMGMVAVGYGDGYPRHAGTGTPAAVRGRRIRLIGRVSMDMLAVDLSPAPEAREGDSVELWGAQVSVDEIAAHAGTIGYELLTGVTARVPRLYR
ncbi:MAG: alanine racemase [Pseudomonadota bacterium]